MKKLNIAFVVVFCALLLATGFAKAEENSIKEEKFKVAAQSYMQKTRIESAIKKIEGVEDAELSLDSKTLTVNFNDKKVNSEKFIKMIEDMEISIEKMRPEERKEKVVFEKKQNSPK